MEKLTIENFLSIRSAEIEVRRINVLIGPQASGKSVIAKLLYFFKHEVDKAFEKTVKQIEGKRHLTWLLTSKFEVIFPARYWRYQKFKICYIKNNLVVTITCNPRQRSSVPLLIEYPDWFIKLLSTSRQQHSSLVYEKLLPKLANRVPIEDNEFRVAFNGYLKESNISHYFENQIFIPASRTFFATLKNNIFSFLASEIAIDFFLKEFGAIYEKAKLNYQKERSHNQEFTKEFDHIVTGIIVGRYLHQDEEDWISSPVGRVINLANASSGQQESLPMLLVLSVIPYLNEEKMGFFIEEPEAHLFPVSQKAFISLLALLSNTTKHQFFITTHSPYLLTALNNCIMAQSTYAAADDAGKQKVLGLVPKNQHIAFEDVAAWTVTAKGTVESILDEELQLIGASLLDEVSQHFETVTNELLDIRYAGKD